MLVKIGPKHWRGLAWAGEARARQLLYTSDAQELMQTSTVDLRGFPGVSNRRFFSACAIFESQAVFAPQPSCFQLDA
jgi:hypothetical protein